MSGDKWEGYCPRDTLSEPTAGDAAAVPEDPVNPSHYKQGAIYQGAPIETIDVIRSVLGEQGFKAYCRGQVLKYVARGPYKNGFEDYQKAAWYLRWLEGEDPR